jgi:arylsulfatase A-like enzyme
MVFNNTAMKTFVLPLLLSGSAFFSPLLAQTSPPNIVVILADDLGYGDVGFNGCPDIPTPNIDALAANGALCTNGYVTHPTCSPSRAAIMTGRYQQRFGHEIQPTFDTLVPQNPRLGLPESELTLAQLLKPAGYVCAAIGKWHLGFAPNLFPTERGFDEFFGFLDAQQGYYNTYIWEYGTLVKEPTYLTDAFTREAVAFIDSHATQPFFLYLAYNAVHKPYDQPPQSYMDRVSYITNPQRQLYAAMAVALDDGVGQVVARLQAQNLLNNTLIFFLSDNGAPDTSYTRNSNVPLSGYKGDMLEGGIHVPFAVQWTGRLPANVVYDDPVSSLDLVPTIAAAAGISLPIDRDYDGLNILPYLAGEQIEPVRTLFWRWFGLGPDGPPGSSNTLWAVRNGSLKLVVERDKDDLPPALYNLSDDIGETQDLAAVQPDDVTSLTQLFAQWTLNTIPPIWQDNTDMELLPLVLAGDWNAFNKGDPNVPWNMTSVTAPDLQGTPDAYNWYTTTIHVASSGGDTTPGNHSFALIGTNSYSEQWGGVTINIDGTTDLPFFSGNNLGPTNTISFENGFYYSLRILDAAVVPAAECNIKLAVMKTSAPPVAVSRTGQTPAIPTPQDPVVVSIGLNQPKSMEERVYLRWSTDNFITSHLIAAQGSGTNYSATIPAQPAGTLLLYTIITSTADLSAYSASGVIDPQVLATTCVFTAVPQTAPQITQQPAGARVRVGRTARFQIVAVGGGTLTYQWMKNGTPIVGATNSSYTTPPVIPADNRSLFSVAVSNGNGSATSNAALLKVR